MQRSLFFMCFCLLGTSSLQAQQLSLEFGRNSSRFDYENSEGKSIEGLLPSGNMHLGAGLRLPIKPDKLNFMGGFTYSKYGASGSDTTLGNRYEWEMNYVGVNVGLEYNLLNITGFFIRKNGFVQDRKGMTLNLLASFSSEFLLDGTQTINNESFALVGTEQFDRPLFFARGGIEFNYTFTEEMSVYLQYLGGKSFPLIKGKSDDNEKLQLVTHQVSLGILVRLAN